MFIKFTSYFSLTREIFLFLNFFFQFYLLHWLVLSSKLVEPYRVSPSIDLEENLNFRVFDDSLIDVDAEELNVVLSSSGLKNVGEEDDNHIEECDEADNNSIEDEDENSD